MVKKWSLIGAIACTAGFIVQIYFFSKFFDSAEYAGLYMSSGGLPIAYNGDWTIQTLFYSLGIFENDMRIFINIFSIIVIYPAMMYISLMGIGSKKLIMILASIAMAVGWILLMLVWFLNANYTMTGKILNGVFMGCTIFYLIGLIFIRQQYKAGIIMGILLVIIAAASNFFFGIAFVWANNAPKKDELANIHLILQCVQSLIFTLHAWLYSFSKKPGQEEEETGKEMSVEEGSAFESYVEPEKKTMKKPKAPASKDVDWQF